MQAMRDKIFESPLNLLLNKSFKTKAIYYFALFVLTDLNISTGCSYQVLFNSKEQHCLSPFTCPFKEVHPGSFYKTSFNLNILKIDCPKYNNKTESLP